MPMSPTDNNDPILNTDTSADSALILAIAGSDRMALWSDEKKHEYVKTFDARSKVTQYLLLATASRIADKGVGRHYISEKHLPTIFGDKNSGGRYLGEARRYTHGFDIALLRDPDLVTHIDTDWQGRPRTNTVQANTIGGRSIDELNTLVDERANVILAELPSVKKAIEIVDAATFKKMCRRDELIDQGQVLQEEITKLCETVKLSDMAEKEPSLTLKDFLAWVKARDATRKQLAEQLEAIGKGGSELEDAINKALFDGLPGLSDAVVAVAKQHIEQATAMNAMSRRVGEQVIFGDSAAALDLLRHFEKDEVKVSDDIQAQFREALEKLKLAAKGTGVGDKAAVKKALKGAGAAKPKSK